MSGRHLVILNPAAGSGAAGSRAGEITRLLNAHGVRHELVLTERPMHAADLAERAAGDGYDAVVAAGGDGTGNEVLNGLLAAADRGLAIPALGMLCVGRGNDFAFGAGVPPGLEEGCAALGRGERRFMDVGRVHGPQLVGPRYFGNGVGIGFDTIVGLEAAKMKRVHGFLGYVLGALKTMFLYYRAPLVALSWAGTTRQQKALQISAMNGRRMGGAFMMTPEARNDDGQLDLCIAGEPRRLAMLGLILRYMKGTQAGSPHITMCRTPTFEVRALEGGLVAHADGELLGTNLAELRMECHAARIQVVTPARA